MPRRSEVVVVEASQGQVPLQEEDESDGGALVKLSLLLGYFSSF